MGNDRFDTRSSETWGSMDVWKRINAETNEDQRERLKRNLRKAIQEELTPQQQTVLLMHYSQNLSGREIAKELDLSPSTVSRTLTRAKRRLNRALKYAF